MRPGFYSISTYRCDHPKLVRGFTNSQVVKLGLGLGWFLLLGLGLGFLADLNLSNLNPNPNPDTKPQPNPNPYPNNKPQTNPNPNFTNWEVAKEVMFWWFCDADLNISKVEPKS